MAMSFAPGDAVQTAHGKGIVRELRNNGQLLVQIQKRTMVVAARSVSPLDRRARVAPVAPASTAVAGPSPVQVPQTRASPEVDLHGLRVDEALARIDDALDAAVRAGLSEIRFIHGKSGGRLRGALHERLRAIAAVRGVRLDPRNSGVTIASL